MGKGMNVIIAAAAGFVGGILLAPKSGADTRRDLMRKADAAKREAAVKAEHAKHAMKEGADTLKSSARDASGELSGLAQSAKSSASRVAGEAKNLSYEAKTRAGRVAENARGTKEEVKSVAEKRTK